LKEEKAMSATDIQQFIDAVAKANAAGLPAPDPASGWREQMGLPSTPNPSWREAVDALSRLAMFDMLPALASVTLNDRGNVQAQASQQLVPDAFDRICFARFVVEQREISDFGIPAEQVNDGRQYLGCTRMDDSDVQAEITAALSLARTQLQTIPILRKYDDDEVPQCRILRKAWGLLAAKRKEGTGASLISDVAAAAHYMLARYHVGSAKASWNNMKLAIEGYDVKKRQKIAQGDPDLQSMAITTGNRPFPPDFALRAWASTGADDGFKDWCRYNKKVSPPLFTTLDQDDLGDGG
jgi:hypothetical protein